MPATKLQRQIDLIAYLVGRHYPVPVEELMERVAAYAERWVDGDVTTRASVRRTFERDKDDLRRIGIPIQTVPYSINFGREQGEGYRIARKDFYLPYLRLLSTASAEAGAGDEVPGYPSPGARRGMPFGGAETVEISEEDAHTALEALRRAATLPSFPFAEEARSAFRKLAFDLDPSAFPEAPVLFVERPGALELAARLRALSDALLARKRVRFRYRGIYRGESTARDVAPYGLLFQHGHWYLVADDATRGGVRVFRVGRIDGDVAVNSKRPNTPDYEIPADFRLRDYAGREAWELGGDDEPPLRALVRFRFPASLLAERNAHGELLETHPDGSADRAFDVVQVGPFLRWILSHEGEAEIVEPTALADELRRMARDVAAAHGVPADGRPGSSSDGRPGSSPNARRGSSDDDRPGLSPDALRGPSADTRTAPGGDDV